MATIEAPEELGFRPIHEFAQSERLPPRAERPAAISTAAGELRDRLRGEKTVRAVRTVDLLTVRYPAHLALGGGGRIARKLVSLVGRLVVARFEAFSGEMRTLAWVPAQAESPAPSRFPTRPGGRYGVGPARIVAPRQLYSVSAALARCGLRTSDIDFVAFGDLRGQDVRSFAGTIRSPLDAQEAREPLFPNALALIQRLELEMVGAQHPIQERWYVPGLLDDVGESRIVALDGDVELGAGVAIIATPGRTAGHQSLVLYGPIGIWVVSGNGVASDCWQPLLSKIPGVRRGAEADGRHAVLDTAAENAMDLHDSMVKEKSLADVSRVDPRWQTILPERELLDAWRQWPLVPTFTHRGVGSGRV